MSKCILFIKTFKYFKVLLGAMTTAIKLTLPDALTQACEELVKVQGYHNIQELALTALRNHISLQHRNWALENLSKNKGKFKIVKNLTREERSRAIDELLSSKRDIFKDHELK
jgi:metal-responsive CopG/Arc/MetJ family transcriptional regulator